MFGIGSLLRADRGCPGIFLVRVEPQEALLTFCPGEPRRDMTVSNPRNHS